MPVPGSSTNPSSATTGNTSRSTTTPTSATSLHQQHASQFQSLCESGDTDELRAYILSRTTIVSNQRKAAQIIDEIVRANEPIALDFEGINLGNDGQITLVQVGTGRGSVFIFDVLTQPGLIEQGEKSLLGRLLCGGGGPDTPTQSSEQQQDHRNNGIVKVRVRVRESLIHSIRSWNCEFLRQLHSCAYGFVGDARLP